MAYFNGQKNLWAAAVAPWMQKFGLFQGTSNSLPDSAETNNFQHTADNAAGTAAVNWVIPVDGSNLTRLNNPNGVVTAGGLTTGGNSTFSEPDIAFANAAGNTIAAASMINGFIRRTGGGAQTDTTDTATNIVAAIPGATVGSSFEMTILNGSGGIHTLGLGVGVTAAAGVTTTLTTAIGNVHTFAFRVTTVAPAAVTIYSVGASAS